MKAAIDFERAHLSDKQCMRLGLVLEGWRAAGNLTVREAANIIGLHYATYSRLERGLGVDGRTLSKVLAWLLEEIELNEPRG